MSERAPDLLVTLTVSIARNGDVFQDTQVHDNSWADVYRGICEVKKVVDHLVDDRRECPYNPKNIRDRR